MEISTTEKRIDDLNDRLAEGFQSVHRENDRLKSWTSEDLQRIDREINGLKTEIRELRKEAS